jgi:Flp pilus assembly protein TadG
MSSINLIFHRPARPFADVLSDREGAVAVLLAIALSAIVGFAGLGSEVAAWYYTKRAMQGAADSAATSAAAALAAATSSGSSVTT